MDRNVHGRKLWNPPCGVLLVKFRNRGGKAIWTADIKEAGKYEVFFITKFHQLTYPPISSVFTGSLLHYKVCNSLIEEEIIMEADLIPVGWVSLGKFDFPVGQAQVILNDRGGGDQG